MIDMANDDTFKGVRLQRSLSHFFGGGEAESLGDKAFCYDPSSPG